MFFISSCSKEQEIIEPPFLEVNVSSIGLSNEANSSSFIEIKSNVEWSFEVLDDGINWCHPYKDVNKLFIEVDGNSEKKSRQTKIVLKACDLEKSIIVTQLGWGKEIILSCLNETIQALDELVTVEVTTNVNFECIIPDDCTWVKQLSSRGIEEHPIVSKPVTFKISNNLSEEDRSIDILFKDVDSDTELLPVYFNLLQKGIGTYKPGNPEDVKDDIKVQVVRGEASSFQPGENIEKSFDGNMNTIYHSKWDNTAPNYFPITLVYYFESNSDMDYFIYYPRTDGGLNGRFKEVKIEIQSNANSRGESEWKTLYENYDFEGRANPTRVDFPESQIGVSAVRLTVKSGIGGDVGFASCAEMEFYKKNPENFTWNTLFKDPLCSELKDGVTEEEIISCKYSLFKNIAYYMYMGKYDKEFRINEFKAYPHPDIQSVENKTGAYSLLDNPTGIYVATDDILVVMADVKDQKVYLRVQNLDKPGGDGFGGIDYQLTTGINKIKIKEGGLIYVMYHSPNYENLPDIGLHFITGNVNGYFDSQNKEHEGRWKELLEKSTDKYFDVLGKYAHLTFPTSIFRTVTSDLKGLIDWYDMVVYNEQLLMGLKKYNRMFKNRMYFNVMYKSFMYATSYHTAYHYDTLKDICNLELISTTPVCWGPCHEVGHINQTRPGLNWHGTAEVTNNIFSQYIRTTLLGIDSYLQTEYTGIKESPNCFSKFWNNILVNRKAHVEETDVFCKLVPFWQLELYFGKVLGKTPLQQDDFGGFYPDVFEYIRTHDDLPTSGEQQLEFVYIASKSAGLNLLDFFEKSGFLTPIEIEIDDYGKSTFSITQSQVENIRNRVESLGYDKPEVALEYITDNTVNVYKNKLQITSGSAIRNGNQITMRDWKNVVAYEVREEGEKGRLICVSDGMLKPSNEASFNVMGGWKTNYKVYAVAYDNSRIEVTF